MKRLLIGLLFLTTPLFAIEYGRFGPTVTSNGTQTIGAVGGAGSGGVMDRNCITNLSVDGTAGFAGAQGSCTFQVASAGSTMWSVAISSSNPTQNLNFPPPPAPGTSGWGLCGNRGQTVTITMTAGGCTGYDISSQGYIDR